MYKEMERQKDQIFKKADPQYQEDKVNGSQGSEQVIGHYDNAKASNNPVFPSERALNIPDYENEGRK